MMMRRLTLAVAAMLMMAVPAAAAPPSVTVESAPPHQWNTDVAFSHTLNIQSEPIYWSHLTCIQNGTVVIEQRRYVGWNVGTEWTHYLNAENADPSANADCEVAVGQYGGNGFHAKVTAQFTISG